ncbi:hypothetical protein TrVE_jg1005 [Triparma verrucosa]|uniref:Uncharacterized protein n=1 Tax=Triparma verrucosa TaxID=1606542 RepID=A0A9W7BM73_9STRA|nr:hypothetical protein TrVE_jg1005 [Triparma verrucosa]
MSFPKLNLAGVAYGTSDLDWESVPPSSVHNPDASTLKIVPSPSGSDFLHLVHEPATFKIRTTVDVKKVGQILDAEGGLKLKMARDGSSAGGSASEATIGLSFMMNEPIVIASIGGDKSFHHCVSCLEQSVVVVKKSDPSTQKKAGGLGSSLNQTFTANTNERVNGEVQISSSNSMTSQGTLLPPPPPPPVSKASVDRVKTVASVSLEMEWNSSLQQLTLRCKPSSSSDFLTLRRCSFLTSSLTSSSSSKPCRVDKQDSGFSLTQQTQTTFKVKRSEAGTFVMSHNVRVNDIEAKSEEKVEDGGEKNMSVGVYAEKKGGEGDDVEITFKNLEII